MGIPFPKNRNENSRKRISVDGLRKYTESDFDQFDFFELVVPVFLTFKEDNRTVLRDTNYKSFKLRSNCALNVTWLIVNDELKSFLASIYPEIEFLPLKIENDWQPGESKLWRLETENILPRPTNQDPETGTILDGYCLNARLRFERSAFPNYPLAKTEISTDRGELYRYIYIYSNQLVKDLRDLITVTNVHWKPVLLEDSSHNIRSLS